MTSVEGTQLLQSFSDAVAQLAEKTASSVVHVEVGGRGGTGIVWSNAGYVVTANHVVGDTQAPRLVTSDGREFEAKVIGRDDYSDITLLKVDARGMTPIQVANAESIQVGQFVLALANALGGKVSATSGIVTSKGRSIRGWWGRVVEDAVISDAKLNPGYSGGPLVDAWGRLLGMNVAYFPGRGVAIPSSSLAQVVETLSKEGKVRKGFLGVIAEPIELPDELTDKDKAGQREGLLVRSVEKSSPARTAGVTIGDIILRLGEVRLADEHRLRKALTGDIVGKTLSLWILRGERLTELKITPTEADS